MDIHKPKPWHGVREFLKEYVIIVVGVLTALGAEQAVEWLHWRHQTELAHAALAYDLKRVMSWSGWQDSRTPCIAARLTELEGVLDRAQSTGRLAPVAWVPFPQQGAWSLRAWSGLTYGQTLAHLGNREQTQLAALNSYMEHLRGDADRQLEGWAVLQTLSGPGRRITDEEIASLRRVIATQRATLFVMRNGASHSETLVLQTGLLSRQEAERAWKDGLARAAANPGPCLSVYSQNPAAGGGLFQALAQPFTAPGSAQLDETGTGGESVR